ncbi:glycosyltransferase family 4 protein [Nitrospiraceae bacterium AH_259_D15_M11_P09]|nr:glycosyltransferase family 4 protein [Nitrospiraceae bacterium AH_259_D15_M11_P09]
MRVAMIEAGGWGGIAHYAWNLCGALSETEAEVILMTNAQYELDHLPRKFSVEPCFDSNAGYLQTVRTLVRRLSSLRPNIVHVQSLISSRFDAFLWALMRRKIPYVYTAHNVRCHEENRWASWTLWRCLRMADAVIAHTPEAVEEVRQRLGPDGRVKLIHHGDYAFFGSGAGKNRLACRRLLSLPIDAQLLLTFGAIRPYKGICGVIAALPRILKRHPDAHLVIAGPLLAGTEREYREAIARACVRDAVIFRPGYVPHDQVATYFASADVAVFNYREVTDSGALRIACSQGTPVVATAVGGFREFLENGVTGRLVPPHDLDALVQAVCDLLADPAAAARMATAAIGLAASRWIWADSAKATLEVYGQVVGWTPTGSHLLASSRPG